MKNIILTVIAVVLASPLTWASSEEFTTYQCESLDNKKPYDIQNVELKMEYSKDGQVFFVRLSFDQFPDHRTYYQIDPTYKPKKNVDKTYYKLVLKDVNGEPLPQGNIQTAMVEKIVIEGEGSPLPNDKLGGFLKLPANGYGWAWYLCQR